MVRLQWGDNAYKNVFTARSAVGLVDMCIKKGVCANDVDHRGDSILMHAVRRDMTAVIRKLLLAGADASLSNDDGDTALHFAMKYSRDGDNIIRYLQG